MHVNLALALSGTLDESKTLDSGPVVSQGHWSEQGVCRAPAAQTSAAMNVVSTHRVSSLLKSSDLFPGLCSQGITLAS